jgi:hypothetical protein
MAVWLYTDYPRLERAKDIDICTHCPAFLAPACNGGSNPGDMQEMRKQNARRRRDGKLEVLPACPRDYAYYFRVPLKQAERVALTTLAIYEDELTAYRLYIGAIDQLIDRMEMLARIKGNGKID